MRKTRVEGFLEIQHDKGVILFQCTKGEDVRKFGGAVLLRLVGLETPIPEQRYTFEITVGETKWNDAEGAIDIQAMKDESFEQQQADEKELFDMKNFEHHKPFCEHCVGQGKHSIHCPYYKRGKSRQG